VIARIELIICVAPAALLWVMTLPSFIMLARHQIWLAGLWPVALFGLVALTTVVTHQAANKPPRSLLLWQGLGLVLGLCVAMIGLWIFLRHGLPARIGPRVAIVILSLVAVSAVRQLAGAMGRTLSLTRR